MYYLSISSIFRQETPWLVEWLDYHIACGVEHFYLYNNDDDPTDASRILRPYVERGVVDEILMPGRFMQMPSMQDVVSRFGDRTYWLALIDLDEFFLPKRTNVISEILENYESFGALAIHWHIFGTNGYRQSPPNQLNYLLRRAEKSNDLHHFVKSIVRPHSVISEKMVTPHIFPLRSGYAVNENFEPVTTAYAPSITASVIRLNHYCLRSRQDYVEVKCRRGLGTPSLHERDERFWVHYDRNEVFDDEISKRFGCVISEPSPT